MNQLIARLAAACVLLLATTSLVAQSTKNEKKMDTATEKHIALEKFPKGAVINFLDGWGDMAVAVNELPKGTDLSPLLDGLKDNLCQVPHWGYIIKGALRVKYADGNEIVLKTGDLFYMPPGHTGMVTEDLKLMDFSPAAEMKGLVKHIEKKLAGHE
jgi:hypothetical protein